MKNTRVVRVLIAAIFCNINFVAGRGCADQSASIAKDVDTRKAGQPICITPDFHDFAVSKPGLYVLRAVRLSPCIVVD